MVSLLNSSYEYLKVIPAKLDELRNADNLHKLSQIGVATLHSYGIYLGLGVPVKAHLYYVFKCTGQTIDFLRMFRLPAMWINKVTADTIDHTDANVRRIENLLMDEKKNALTGNVHKITQFRNIGERPGALGNPALRNIIRDALDTVLKGDIGYSEVGFKKTLEKELSTRFSTVNRRAGPDVFVNLDEYKVCFKPKSVWETALLVSRTFTIALVNVALLQEWKVINITDYASKIGLSQVFNSNYRGGITQSNIIFVSMLATYILKSVDNLVRYSSMRSETLQAVNERQQKVNNVQDQTYVIFKASMSMLNATLFTFGIFRLQSHVFYGYISFVKSVELIGEMALKPKAKTFVEHTQPRGA